jgi:hypothetical protein
MNIDEARRRRNGGAEHSPRLYRGLASRLHLQVSCDCTKVKSEDLETEVAADSSEVGRKLLSCRRRPSAVQAWGATCRRALNFMNGMAP